MAGHFSKTVRQQCRCAFHASQIQLHEHVQLCIVALEDVLDSSRMSILP